MRISRKLMWGALSVPLVAFGAGCASQSAAFRPAPSTETMTSSNGYRAAYYDIEINNKVDGTVKVWSQGAYHLKSEDQDIPVIDLRLSIRNDTDAPMTVQARRTDVEMFTSNDEQTVLKEPLDEAGPTTIEPGSIEQYRFVYELPDDVEPGNIEEFDLNWSVKTADGTFSRSTHFNRYGYNGYGYGYAPYAYGYPYWGWGPYGYPYWWDFDFFGGSRFGHFREFHGGHGFRGAPGPRRFAPLPKSAPPASRSAPAMPRSAPRSAPRSPRR